MEQRKAVEDFIYKWQGLRKGKEQWWNSAFNRERWATSWNSAKSCGILLGSHVGY
jgi:hypothetical protein